MSQQHLSADEWQLNESELPAHDAAVLETLMTVGNGKLGTRGSLEEGGVPGGLPGTFISGVYDAYESRVTDLVNAPDWLATLIHVDGRALDVQSCTVVSHERTLDFRHGLLWRRTVFEDDDGRRTQLVSSRFASMKRRELAVLRVEVTALNHTSVVSVDVRLDGQRRNLDRQAVYAPGTIFDPAAYWETWTRSRHLDAGSMWARDDVLYLETVTQQSAISLGYAAATDYSPPPRHRTVRRRNLQIEEHTEHVLEAGQTLVVDRYVAIHTSRDVEPAGLADRCAADASEARIQGFETCLEETAAAWDGIWTTCDCRIIGDPVAQHALRYGLYQLLIAANPDDPSVNIGAKSLTGEGYRGHVFWDTEALMLPFFVFTRPETARTLLRYRHERLEAARELARESGCSGARFPWESADTGLEECPVRTDDGAFRFWSRDEEVHVSACVAFGVLTYLAATGDTEFLLDYGAELLFETSRFWVGRSSYDDESGAYSIRQVMGPDEFHSHVDDNAFTNTLVRWTLLEAASVHDQLATSHPSDLRELLDRIGMASADVDQWRAVGKALVTGRDETTGLVEQFSGYFQRKDVPVTDFTEAGMPQYPEGYHHFNCEDTMLLKQPDVLMLMHMLPDVFDRETKRKNFDFYEPRTLHKSSLSPAIHAILGIEVGDHSHALPYFRRSALVDLTNNQGNTREGVHIASAAGTWQILVHGFGGFRLRHGQLSFDPWLPEQWEEISFRLQWRGGTVDVAIDHSSARFGLDAPAGSPQDGSDSSEEIRVFGLPITLIPGQQAEVSIQRAAPSSSVAPPIIASRDGEPR